ncbi:DUF86 domain-containing protein [Candidatus Pacearchaeota archaeon]|nr:DUF86 domain-containing protein [Candidatus Pacearchaeota archaeon]
MYDIERIGKIIADISKYCKELESYGISKVDNLHDSKTYNASSMAVFAILNRLIDLGSEIISAENLGAPDTYQDIMPILSKAGIMNKEQSEKLNKLIRKRNVLAHFYEDMDEKELFKTIKEIPEALRFAEAVKKRIK